MLAFRNSGGFRTGLWISASICVQHFKQRCQDGMRSFQDSIENPAIPNSRLHSGQSFSKVLSWSLRGTAPASHNQHSRWSTNDIRQRSQPVRKMPIVRTPCKRRTRRTQGGVAYQNQTSNLVPARRHLTLSAVSTSFPVYLFKAAIGSCWRTCLPCTPTITLNGGSHLKWS